MLESKSTKYRVFPKGVLLLLSRCARDTSVGRRLACGVTGVVGVIACTVLTMPSCRIRSILRCICSWRLSSYSESAADTAAGAVTLRAAAVVDGPASAGAALAALASGLAGVDRLGATCA